ncbi:MAG: helix-turn-helix domain-containing protein, partial [Rhodobacterales bacterium]|nr:helix-turn-helix domain-containing protein [Rhodobacterales bacterium]
MNKIPPHMEQALDGSEPGVGHLLRVARERRREDLEDVAENLCIRWVHLNAIESGSYEDLPGKTYAVGFVRSYAEYLGLDADEVVRRFRAESAALRASSDLHFPSPVSETGFPGGRVLGLGLLLVALGYGGWYMTSQKDSALGELIAPIPERLAGLLPEGLRPAPSEAPDVQPGTPAARAPAPEPRPVTPAPPAPLVTHLTSSPSSDPAPAAAPQPETPVA